MPNLEYGLRRGLSVKLPDPVQDVRYHYAVKQRAEAQAQAQAKLFADDMDYNNAMNGHDNPIVKQYAQAKIKELGGFLRQNPDWQMDVSKLAEYKRLTRELKDNPDLNRGMQSDAAYREMLKFEADPKNRSLANDPEFLQNKQQWQNYVQYGNQFGEEALKKDGKRAFSFIPPDIFDDEADIANTFSKLQTRERALTGKDYKGSKGLGATIAEVPFSELQLTAMGKLRDPATGYKYKNIWEKMPDVEKTMYGNIVNWMAMRGKNYTKQEIKTGEFPQWYFQGGRGGNGDGSTTMITPFLNQIASKESGSSANLDHLSPMYDVGGGKKVYKPNSNMPITVLLKNGEGKVVPKTVNGYAGQELESNVTGHFKTFGGQKWVEMRSRVPLREDLTAGDLPLFTHGKAGWFGNIDKENYEDVEGFRDVASVETKDGEKTGYGIVTHWVPMETDPSRILNYDNNESGMANANKAYNPTQQAINQNQIRVQAQRFGGTPGTYNGVPAIEKDGRVYDLNGNLLK